MTDTSEEIFRQTTKTRSIFLPVAIADLRLQDDIHRQEGTQFQTEDL